MPDLKLPIRFSLISALASMFMAISGCVVPHSKNIAFNKTSCFGIDSALGESLYLDEEVIAEKIESQILLSGLSASNTLRGMPFMLDIG